MTINKKLNKKFYKLLKKFYDKTNCPIIINTSFNVRGEPIVCTPKDAYLCFMRTEMDYLIMGNYLLDKKDQKPISIDSDFFLSLGSGSVIIGKIFILFKI